MWRGACVRLVQPIRVRADVLSWEKPDAWGSRGKNKYPFAESAFVSPEFNGYLRSHEFIMDQKKRNNVIRTIGRFKGLWETVDGTAIGCNCIMNPTWRCHVYPRPPHVTHS